MNRRWIGYTVWLLLTVCLYFFENNTGTRVVLLCSLLLPFVPSLRHALFSPDESGKENIQGTQTVRLFTRQESEEAGDIRQYMPGDPVRRIHWKLFAKKGELLVRDTIMKPETTEEKTTVSSERKQKKQTGKRFAAIFAAGIAICLLLLLLIPEANRGVQALCNRLFTASEAVNSYEYFRFSVQDNQNVVPAAFLLLCIPVLLLAVTAVIRSRLTALGIMAACTLFQVYFGLAFSAWINIPLYGLLGLWMMMRPFSRKRIMAFCAFVLLVSLLVLILLPGVDAATETASEQARDRLARLAEKIAGTVPEMPAGETETRHIHTRSLENGDREAETEQEFRLVTVEEEQISMPYWINWMKVIMLLLLAVALVTVPFVPFLVLNARKKKAQAIRKTFDSDNVSEAVQAIFRQIILWLEIFNHGAEILLYRDWAGLLPDSLPEDYSDRFTRCAADFEEAFYSNHEMPEQKRRNALKLLKDTETALWKTANRRQRLHLKYWMCMHE